MTVRQLTVGSFATNCYMVIDEAAKEGFVIDPGGDGERILSEITRNGMKVKGILLTHGHYDHFAVVDRVAEGTGAPVLISQADACWFYKIPSFFGPVTPPKTKISRYLEHGQRILALFCGDTLFWRSVGRCDLPGGDWNTLLSSIHNILFKLPDETVVYCGHGPETTIGEERKQNPYL